MDLVPISDMLAHARKNCYAVGGFNVFNLEMLNPIVRAAKAENSSVIVQLYSGDLANVNGKYIAAMTKIAAQKASVPIALQLDHGTDYQEAVTCIDWGFSSLMIDLSCSSYEQNIKQTDRLVKEAHGRGVAIEAELGKIFSGRDPVEKQKSALTDINRAARFVHETGVDALAISVGTAHGEYSHGPDINFELLKSLIEKVKVPIVIHGGSFIPDNDILRMIKFGVAKINIGTELMLAFYKGLKNVLQKRSREDADHNVLGPARSNVEKVVRAKIRLFNTYRDDKRSMG